MRRTRGPSGPLRPLAEYARSLAGAIDAWGEGRSAPSVPPPTLRRSELLGAGLPAAEVARLARSVERLADWPARASRLAARLAPPSEPEKKEVAALLSLACRSLAEGVSRLPSDADAAARSAAKALSASNAVERKRSAAARAAVDAPPLDSMRLRSLLEAYAWACDALERSAVDLATAAAACGRQERP